MQCTRCGGLALIFSLMMLSGCSLLDKPLQNFRTLAGLPQQLTTVTVPAPAMWQAPLPHAGKLSNLSTWWQQFHDPLLVQLINAAEQVSPSLTTAKARIVQARSQQTIAQAALLPEVNATGSASRGLESLFFPAATISSLGLAARWELDLFGGNQAALAAAGERLAGANADWHDARVLLAAEVANQYNTFRSCEVQLIYSQTALASWQETAALTEQLVSAGLQNSARLSLAQANVAQAQGALTTQQARCTLAVKALVALTAWEEPKLRAQLTSQQAQLLRPEALVVNTVPAEALAQRPDIFAAAREVLASSADVSQLQAQRYPKISFSGKIGLMQMELSPAPRGGTVWTIGPVAVTLPLFDGGLRSANVTAARARYDAAGVNYRAKLRTAVKEVEEALVNLHSLQQRTEQAQQALDGFTQAFTAQKDLYAAGLVSLLELNDALRAKVQAQSNLVEVQREHVTAWISLYRALGGGWQAAPPHV